MPRARLRAPLSSCDARPSASACTCPATRKLPALPSKVSPFSSSKVLQPDSIPEGCGSDLFMYFSCGHFLELRRGKAPSLLVAQRLDRIDARRASRRNVASRQRHTEQDHCDARKRRKIRRGYAEQQTRHQPRENKGQSKS